MIDLSFTKSPEWIGNREKLWCDLEADLKTIYRRKEVQQFRHFFFTGELVGNLPDDEQRFLYFPLSTQEGYDHVLSSCVKDKKVFKDLIEFNFMDHSNYTYLKAMELASWDYFLTEKFESTITSRVPINGEYKTVNLDVNTVFVEITACFLRFVQEGDCGDWPKWLQRPNYYWSLWPLITDQNFLDRDAKLRSDSDRCAGFIGYLFEHIVEHKPIVKFPDPNQTRPKFLALLAEKMDEMYDDLCPRLQQLWDETKAKKAAKEAGQ